jgi:hydrogenase maturation factor
MTDTPKDLKDHDLLIEIHVSQDHLTKTMDGMAKHMETQNGLLLEHTKEIAKGKVWTRIIGITVLGAVGASIRGLFK